MADNGAYNKALLHLQDELVKMQQWVRDESQRVVIVIEGRDAAGKGGVTKRIAEYSIPDCAGSLPYRRRTIVKRAGGTFSATSPTFPPEGTSSCSTAAARLNCIAHLLSVVPYDARKPPKVKLPPRPPVGDYQRPPRDCYHSVPDYSATIT
jgi:polyphosphate kinase 2 (PPK2 family)